MTLRQKNQSGSMLPLTLILLTVFGIMALLLVTRLSGPHQQEFVGVKMKSKNYGLAAAAADRVKYIVERPDDPSQAIHWTESTTQTYTFTIDGEDVSVTLEHTNSEAEESPPPPILS